MLVKFHQAVHLKGKTVKGKDYSRGVHEVPEEHLADPHFHKLVKAGLVEDGEAAKVVSPVSLEERQKLILEKSAQAAKAKVAAMVKAQAPAADKVVADPKSPSQGPSAIQPEDDVSGDATLSSPPAGELQAPSDDVPPPAEKSEEEQLAEMQAEEDAKAAKADADKSAKGEKAKAESSKKSQQKK